MGNNTTFVIVAISITVSMTVLVLAGIQAVTTKDRDCIAKTGQMCLSDVQHNACIAKTGQACHLPEYATRTTK